MLHLRNLFTKRIQFEKKSSMKIYVFSKTQIFALSNIFGANNKFNRIQGLI